MSDVRAVVDALEDGPYDEQHVKDAAFMLTLFLREMQMNTDRINALDAERAANRKRLGWFGRLLGE